MYDYSKLVGKIYEKFGTKKNFCKALDISMTTFIERLANRSDWKQWEIERAMELIDEPLSEIGTYFFTH